MQQKERNYLYLVIEFVGVFLQVNVAIVNLT
jgi:hypothetical protein